MLTCRKDIVFKNVFLVKTYINLLKNLIKTITGEEYEILGYNDKELANYKNTTKRKILDMLLTIQDGKINIEINGFKEAYSHERNMSYVCNLYGNYTKTSEKYDPNYKIVQINLSYGLGSDFGIKKYTVKNGNGNYVNNLTIYEVSMDYFMKVWYSQSVKEIIKYRYLIMLNLETKEELLKLYEITKDKEMIRYMDKVESLSNDKEFVDYVTEEEKRKFDEKFIYANGRRDGIAEGLNESKLDIAKKMLKDNLPYDMISKYTNLSEKKIKSL